MARERQLQAERDRWRTLLEMTNAVVTQRDVAALRSGHCAERPSDRPARSHEPVSHRRTARLGPFVVDPADFGMARRPGGAPSGPDTEPYTLVARSLDRAVDVDVMHADPTGWEALHAHVVRSRCEADLQRAAGDPSPGCRDPLATAA